MKKIKGFTLVEILVVMAILLLMIVILIGILNPIALVNKAKDSRRKKDLNRIKVAFEEYYNDKGCYPNLTKVIELMDSNNCGAGWVFTSWLRPWPCDPNGKPYEIWTGYDDDCPKMFKIFTTLENKSDPSINIVAIAENDPNYAVSSGNISAGGYLGDNNPNCSDGCHKIPEDFPDGCNSYPSGCDGPNCYRDNQCSPECQVTSCSP